MRERQGPRLFGCDECLTACPFGRRQREAPSPTLPTDANLARDALVRLIEEGRARFKRTFGHSPVPRALKRGFLRNAASALAHAGEPASSQDGAEHRALIEALLEETDPAVRLHAAWALDWIGAAPSRDALALALEHEEDEAVAAEMYRVLEAGRPGSA
jgi:epoxyqueuosine reductase